MNNLILSMQEIPQDQANEYSYAQFGEKGLKINTVSRSYSHVLVVLLVLTFRLSD